MAGSTKQSGFFKGIYEFEDPSGSLIAAKIPAIGTADLYDGTTVIVKPNQCAMFIYKGKITDFLFEGIHTLKTGNIPLLTKLANWKFNFRSPLQAEIWFFSGNVFTARRWGTAAPVMSKFDKLGVVPIRAFGNYNFITKNPRKLFETLIGSRTSLYINDLEEFIQGQLIELLPKALTAVTELSKLSQMHDDVSILLEKLMKKELKEYGIKIKKIQILSLLPPKEVLEALEAKMAMQIVGNKRDYLLYKAASSLDDIQENGGQDSMQMMMGLMLGKGLIGNDFRDNETSSKEIKQITRPQKKQRENSKYCHECGKQIQMDSKFCSYCGGKQ